jgi:hypothetical protein
MALRHLSDRCDRVEAHMAGNGGQAPDLAAAQTKAAGLRAQMRIDKIEEAHASYREKREERLNPSPAEPADEPENGGSLFKPPPLPKDGSPVGGWFDPSSGDRAQKTEKYPMGNSKTRDEMWKYGSDIRGNAATVTPVDTRLTSPIETAKGSDPQSERTAAAFAPRGESEARGQLAEEDRVRDRRCPCNGVEQLATQIVFGGMGSSRFSNT